MRIPETIISDNVVRNIKKLYPKHEASIRVQEYYISKLKQTFLVALVGIILIIVAILGQNNESIIENGSIKRNTYGEGARSVSLDYEVIGEDNQNKNGTVTGKTDNSGEVESDLNGSIQVEISEKRYNTTQICKLIEEFKSKLIKIILSDNESQDYVVNNMSFVKSVQGYPFNVKYQTDNPSVLSREGIIKQDELDDDGVNVTVNALISYYDYEENMEFSVCVYKKPVSESESIAMGIEEALKEEDTATSENDYFTLPSNIKGKNVVFSNKKTSFGFLLVAFLTVSVVAVFFLKDKELEKEINKRNRNLIDEYPGFINRFALFYTAGIPVKHIFFKMCSEYEKKKDDTGEYSYLYEELIYVRKLIVDGENEEKAYEEFSGRISLPQYKEFISFVIQDLRNGRKDMAAILKREAEDAFIKKVNNSKKLLEEAGTKLLIPMFMMLIVVMIMIMVPAFRSFN